MADQGDRHVACVNTWLDRAKRLPPMQLLDASQAAFDALWARTHRSLGDVTLTAIVDRVLCSASDAFPELGAMQAETGRFPFRKFRTHASRLPLQERADAIRFVLVEFLTVLGNLTAEILTPALHSELSNVSLGKTRHAPAGKRHPSRSSHTRRS
ncbi:MAG: hypothetical protein M3O46_04950 [Myxococcota bacterium]|nr:hypothetical protein [Myxococcota bacterium]